VVVDGQLYVFYRHNAYCEAEYTLATFATALVLFTDLAHAVTLTRPIETLAITEFLPVAPLHAGK
jgi:hypothetical protein